MPFPFSFWGAFSPKSIPGLAAWYDARQAGYSEGQEVAQWNDLTGNGRHATQAVSSNRPVFRANVHNGRPGVEFITSGKMLSAADFFGPGYDTAFSIYALLKRNSTAAFRLWGSIKGGSFAWYGSDNGGAYHYSAGLSTPAIQITNSLPDTCYVDGFRYNGTTKSLSQRTPLELKTASQTVSGNMGLYGPLTLGDIATGGYTWLGWIMEVLIYNRGLSAAEDAAVRRYLEHTAIQGTSIVIFDGNSLTSGQGATAPENNYPSRVAANLTGWFWFNRGVSSKTTNERASAAGTDVDPFAHPSRTKNVAVLWEVTNDLYFNSNATSAYDNYVNWCNGRRAAGFQVVAVTVLPRSQGGLYAGFESDRQWINAQIRSNWQNFANALADVAADSRIGAPGAEQNTTYYTDKIHLTDAGYAIVADIVHPAILTL